VTRLGVQEGEPLIVDLSDRIIDSWPALWDALAEPCGLPTWFGRNLDAWWDTLDHGAISSVLDAHPLLVLRFRPTGMFAPGRKDGAAFVEVTEESSYGKVEFV
jgi:Barstar (barnase inhibitor)